MAILSGGPLSSLPISGQAAAGAVAADDTIPTQTTCFDEGFYGHDETLILTEGVLSSPLEDTAVVVDAAIFQFHGFYDLVIDEESANYQPEWSRGPPTDQFDETGQTTGWTSNNDWVEEFDPVTDGWLFAPLQDAPVVTVDDIPPALLGEVYPDEEPVTGDWVFSPLEDAPAGTDTDIVSSELGQVWPDEEPVTDGWISLVPTDQFDETGQTTGETSNNDWVDEQESVTDGWLVAPAEDALVAAIEDTPQPLLGEIHDEAEPVTEGWVVGPLEDAPVAAVDDVPQPLLGEIYDQDEPVTDGWFQTVPTDQFDETGQTTGGASNNDWVDEFEPVTDGWFQNVPTDEFDETGQTTGQTSNNDWVDELEPVTDGFTQGVPTDQFDETGQTTGGMSNEDWTPEDEPIVQDWVYFQADESQPVFNDELNDTLLGEIFPDEEPLTEGTFGLPFQDAPPVIPDPVDTCFPADHDLDGPECPADFFAGFTASPLEDTPEVVTGTPGLWYDLKTKKKRKKLIFPLLEDDEPEPEVAGEAPEAPETVPERPTLKYRLTGPRGHNKPLPVPVINPAGFVPMDIQGWKLLIAGVLQSKSIAEAEARHEALRKEQSRRAADILLSEEVQRWKKFSAEFHAAREARELEEIRLIYAVWEIIDDAD